MIVAVAIGDTYCCQKSLCPSRTEIDLFCQSPVKSWVFHTRHLSGVFQDVSGAVPGSYTDVHSTSFDETKLPFTRLPDHNTFPSVGKRLL